MIGASSRQKLRLQKPIVVRLARALLRRSRAERSRLIPSGGGAYGRGHGGGSQTALALVKRDGGHGNVDNISDATKNAARLTLTNKHPPLRTANE
jgi:hypothetical protein